MSNSEIVWEKVTLIVDSGASDTVVPPSMCANAPLHRTEKVGTEYEVADGGVVENFGEKRCLMKISPNASSAEAMNMVFQVVDVSKALLSVYKVCQAGHQVVFGKDECDLDQWKPRGQHSVAQHWRHV